MVADRLDAVKVYKKTGPSFAVFTSAFDARQVGLDYHIVRPSRGDWI
jgi:histidinol phosphatase-like PHP family hydrolase